MKIAYSWLQNYIGISENTEIISGILTSIGLEVEGVSTYEEIPGSLEGIVIGEVLTCEKHPNADKLSKTTVDIGEENPVPIVCGAPNVAAGQKVLVATVNAMLYPTEGEPFKIKKSKIRGEASQGMICAEDELGLGQSHAGIMVLDTDLPNGTPAREYIKPFIDEVIEIGLTPNRADAASHWGVARDLKAKMKRDLCSPEIEDFKVDNQDLSIEVVVENTEACPRYSAVSISGIKVAESPKWLKNRLLSIGLTPINNVVDVTNFVLHEMGQPLHAFDADEIAGEKVIVKNLPQDTPFISLDEQTRKLSEQDLMICDGEGKGMCIAGVFGGIKSGVSEKTQNVFLESAYFSPASIRKSSQYHGLKTDASFRFERGIDPNGTIFALKRAALLIQEVAGGKISSELIDIYPEPIENFEFGVKYKHIDRLIGKVLDRAYIHTTLQNLDIELSDMTEEGFQVSVPPYRVDVQREADIIEEIARLYGYDNMEISPNLGADFLSNFPVVDAHKTQFQITQLLASNGYFEMMNNSLTKPGYTDLVPDLDSANNVEILNKLSEELGVMRQSLVFSGLEVLAYNLNRKQKDLKVFEFGKIYAQNPETEKDGTIAPYHEQTRLAIFVTGDQNPQSWRNPQQTPVQFHDLATTVQMVLQRMNITEFKAEPSQEAVLGYGLTYYHKKQAVGHIGLIKKVISNEIGIEDEVFYADLDWDYLLKNYQNRVSLDEISKFPEVRRDLSLVLDRGVSFQAIQALALEKERKLLKAINVFDVYEGESIGKGKKAYAISFILEDKTQTLKDKVIEKTMNKLMAAFESELGAVIRK